MSFNQGMNKRLWYIYTVDYYLPIRKEPPIHPTTQMNPKCKHVCERSKFKMLQTLSFYLYGILKKKKKTQNIKQIGGCQGLKMEEGVD